MALLFLKKAFMFQGPKKKEDIFVFFKARKCLFYPFAWADMLELNQCKTTTIKQRNLTNYYTVHVE